MKIKFSLIQWIIIIIMLVLLKISSHGIYQYPAFSRSWLIPTVLLILDALIILFIWTLFSRYYHYSLPQKLFKFLTEKDSRQGKQAKTIQALSEKIEHYYEEKNLMIAALSHDIKTPLTEALLELEVLGPTETDPIGGGIAGPIAESIKEKLLRINRIINSSLEYSKEPEKIHKEPQLIFPMLNKIAENYLNFGFPVKIISEDKNITWPIEPSLFQRMIQNLLDNAKRYATHAEIKLSRDTPDLNCLILEISDDGPGVPEDILGKLSTPYFRADPARSQDTGGSGLGLAIVRKIAELHEGTLELSNQKPEGFKIKLRFKNQS